MNLPDEPVETVGHVSVVGARVMEGTWEGGEQAVLIAEVHPVEPLDARLAAMEGEL